MLSQQSVQLIGGRFQEKNNNVDARTKKLYTPHQQVAPIVGGMDQKRKWKVMDKTLQSNEDGTMKAMRIGLEAMRKRRDQLDAEIRECERFFKTPTKAVISKPVNTPKVLKIAEKRDRKTPKRQLQLTVNGIRAALLNKDGSVATRGQIVKILLDNTQHLTLDEIAKVIGRPANTISYSINHSPRGLFSIERDGIRIKVGLSATGAMLAKQVLPSESVLSNEPLNSPQFNYA